MAQSTSTQSPASLALYALFVIAVAVFAYSVLVASPVWGAIVSLVAGYVVVRAFPRR